MKDAPERKLRNYKQLAAISTEQVAQIAATLLSGSEEPADAIRKAYTLLDIAEHCNLSLSLSGSVEAGIKSYEEGVAIDSAFYSALEKVSHYEHKFDENGKKLPVPLDEGLNVLIPKPGVPKAKEAEARRARLRLWMTERWVEVKPDQSEQDRSKEIKERIAKMEREGVSPEQFDKWLVLFPEWWRQKLSETRSVAGQKGRQAKMEKKGKQGRVTSKADKRLGARPPVLKLSEGDEGA